ncbi:MAG: 50S ribosomal protein L25 [Saprospiraceae bacterium]|jgi:large subunit ribosomal protein L25|nr:50S ribosomal protein L25 [Saprospiraceae bacterium]
MEKVIIKANTRAEVGSTAAKSSRNNGMVPGVIYGGKDVIHFEADPVAFRYVIYSPDFKILNVELGGKTHKCILKSTQFHPISEKIEHIDLLELVDGQTFKCKIPLRFKGTSPGVKVGGKFVQKLRVIDVKTTPDKLVNELFADISSMELGGTLRVRDIQVNDGIEITNPPAIPVASIEIPRALRNQNQG